MPDEQTNTTDTSGEEGINGVKDDKENISELDKLKASNDEIEKELIRGRELRAEGQKLEAEKMLGGQTVAGQEVEKPKELTDEEFTEKFERGEIDLTK